MSKTKPLTKNKFTRNESAVGNCYEEVNELTTRPAKMSGIGGGTSSKMKTYKAGDKWVLWSKVAEVVKVSEDGIEYKCGDWNSVKTHEEFAELAIKSTLRGAKFIPAKKKKKFEDTPRPL